MVQGTRIKTSIFGVHMRNGGDLGADSTNCEKMLNVACSEMRKKQFHDHYLSRLQIYEF